MKPLKISQYFLFFNYNLFNKSNQILAIKIFIFEYILNE